MTMAMTKNRKLYNRDKETTYSCTDLKPQQI